MARSYPPFPAQSHPLCLLSASHSPYSRGKKNTHDVQHLETSGGDVIMSLPTTSGRPIAGHLKGRASWDGQQAAARLASLSYSPRRSWLQLQAVSLLGQCEIVKSNVGTDHSGLRLALLLEFELANWIPEDLLAIRQPITAYLSLGV